MKHLMLQPTQIPMCWEVIKYCVAKVFSLEEEYREPSFNRLLYMLLSSKAQCFVRLNDDREIIAVTVTRVGIETLSGDKVLYIEVAYSFKPVSDDEWKNLMKLTKEFARETGCKSILAYTTIPRAGEVARAVGMTERFRCFGLDL